MTDSLRIDRWLFHCRFFKTRSKATAAVNGGHVRLNGERAAPGARVSVGDRIDLVRDRLPWTLEVLAIRLGEGYERLAPAMRKMKGLPGNAATRSRRCARTAC